MLAIAMTAQAPNLLGDDGSASVATGVMMSHHGMRRDLARFSIALRQLAEGDTSRLDPLKEEWKSFHGALHGHHAAEDTGLFPHVRGENPALAGVIDRLTADHRQIDPILAQGDRAFEGLPATASDAAQVVSRLSALLEPHLATEEEHVIPVLRGIQFPPFPDSELQMFAEGFAWASQGIAAEVLERVNETLPEALRAKLPAARAAFQQRCDRVWGPTPAGASHTPIPDWLGGR
jgi:hemerythrin-like domain-containing protein